MKIHLMNLVLGGVKDHGHLLNTIKREAEVEKGTTNIDIEGNGMILMTQEEIIAQVIIALRMTEKETEDTNCMYNKIYCR